MRFLPLGQLALVNVPRPFLTHSAIMSKLLMFDSVRVGVENNVKQQLAIRSECRRELSWLVNAQTA